MRGESTCSWCGAEVESGDGFRAYEPAGERRGDLLPARARRPVVDPGAHWEPGELRRAVRPRPRRVALLALRRRARRRPRAAGPPPRRPPRRRRLLLGRAHERLGEGRRALAVANCGCGARVRCSRLLAVPPACGRASGRRPRAGARSCRRRRRRRTPRSAPRSPPAPRRSGECPAPSIVATRAPGTRLVGGLATPRRRRSGPRRRRSTSSGTALGAQALVERDSLGEVVVGVVRVVEGGVGHRLGVVDDLVGVRRSRRRGRSRARTRPRSRPRSRSPASSRHIASPITGV